MKDNFFTIIGGMGTMATELYIKMINRKTLATNDQEYLNYILVNYATIPDRSSYITNPTDNENPLPYLLDVIHKQNKLEPDFFVLTCNTAHYFYQELQGSMAVPLLHMPKLAVESLSKDYPKGARVGIIGTEGTIKNKIYDPFIEEAGYQVVHPTLDIQKQVSSLIFDKIKNENKLDVPLYRDILKGMLTDLSCDVVLLGCTELSLMEEAVDNKHQHVVDPQNILADETVRLAQHIRKKGKN